MRARALVLCVDWLVVITITTIVTIMVVVVAAAATVSLFSYLRLMPKDYNWSVYCLLTYFHLLALIRVYKQRVIRYMLITTTCIMTVLFCLVLKPLK